MRFKDIRNVYFLGIGGIGMSAIARFFHAQGKKVAGYDKTPTLLTGQLIEEGIAVHYTDDPGLIPEEFRRSEDTLIVRTPAVPADHKELNYLREKGFSILKRSEVLGMITSNSFTVAVAGTHGKTTTSTLIAHLLRSAGISCTSFLGGISKNYQTNLLIGNEENGRHVMVVEADEFDRSFLTLFPDIAVITSIDPDHLDIYGSEEEMRKTYRQFASQVKKDGLLIHRRDIPVKDIKAAHRTYSLNGPADIFASGIVIRDHQYHFNWTDGHHLFKDLTTQMPGEHNVENAIAAVAVGVAMGLDESAVRKGLASYTGVKRRFDYCVRTDHRVYIDDYAHHPEELRAAIQSARDLYPGRRITGIFQPHLYTRTRDFVEGFARSLSMLDELLLLDIYPARELPIEGITSKIIFDKVTIADKKLVSREMVLDELKKRPPEILLTLGAGDIDQLVAPLTNYLNTLS